MLLLYQDPMYHGRLCEYFKKNKTESLLDPEEVNGDLVKKLIEMID